MPVRPRPRRGPVSVETRNRFRNCYGRRRVRRARHCDQSSARSRTRPQRRSGDAPARQSHRRGRTLLATLVVLLLALPAAAHPDDEERPAGDLVRQAIALLATSPDDREELREKLDAARQAADTTGVDLPLVEQAAAALFDEDDPHQARALLERAVGAQPHLALNDPAPTRQTRPAPESTGPAAPR